jgi:hypothetical protein
MRDARLGDVLRHAGLGARRQGLRLHAAGEQVQVRYCTIGFDPISNLDDGDMWPTSFAILKIGLLRGRSRPR